MLLTGKHHRVWEEHSISNSVHLVAFGFLVPIFFVSVGLNTSIVSAFSNLDITLSLILIALIGTVVGSMIGVVLSKGSLKEGLLVGFGVSPKGDTELVLATLALQVGIIKNDIFSAIVIMAMITTLLSPIAFRILIKKYRNILNVKN